MDERDEPYLNSEEIARYLGGISVKLVRALCAQRRHPLPHVRIGGKRLILSKRRWLDDWAAQTKRQTTEDANNAGERLQEVPL